MSLKYKETFDHNVEGSYDIYVPISAKVRSKPSREQFTSFDCCPSVNSIGITNLPTEIKL